MKRIVVLVMLLVGVLGMAHMIEVQARPSTNREGVHVTGGHEH